MKTFLCIILLSVGLLSPLSAVLPPLYQTAHEIEAIVTSPELDRYLTSADVLTSIEKVKEGYQITTNKHRLLVNVIYQPLQQPGPARFVLKFNKAQPL